MLDVKVDKRDPTDLYEQVAAEIRRAFADGDARPGERLPPADVDWSSDGEWIIYNVEPLPDVVDQLDGRGSIWAVHPDGADDHVLVPATDEWMFVKPVWSPDGKELLAGCNTPGGGVDRLCVIDLESGDVTVVVDHASERLPVNFPAWAPVAD